MNKIVLDRGKFIKHDQAFEPSEIEDVSYDLVNPSLTAMRLQIDSEHFVDPSIELKARTIDKHIRQNTEDFLQDSEIGFKNGFNFLLERLDINLDHELQKGNSMKIMDRLFSEVAIHNNLSSDTFIKESEKAFKEAKVNSLKEQLRELLK
jgi:hypothetical protein|tara:strand:+ start:1403 stop:1852 length:450 start_codon:yes stop_codon:yes gene_type:complete